MNIISWSEEIPGITLRGVYNNVHFKIIKVSSGTLLQVPACLAGSGLLNIPCPTIEEAKEKAVQFLPAGDRLFR